MGKDTKKPTKAGRRKKATTKDLSAKDVKAVKGGADTNRINKASPTLF